MSQYPVPDWHPEAIDRLIAMIREQHSLQQWQQARRLQPGSAGRSTRYVTAYTR